jgi:RimJ/RimL family protein N-acetyltransferase
MKAPVSLPIPAPVIPVIETNRLLLRGHRMEDFEHSASMWADPKVTQHILEHPLTEEEAWFRFLRYAGHWALLGFGYWAIIEKQSGNFAGEAGFADYKREIEPSLKGVPEIGWVLAAHAHGRGLATEAVLAITAWGDEHFNSPTACIISPGNAASFRVATKCGYREERETTYHGHSVVMFSRERAVAGNGA